MEGKDLTIRQATAIDYADAETIETLKQTVAQGATDAELKMFIQFCRSTGLNPFKKEIWFIKTKGYTKRDGSVVEGRVQMMTGINGFLAIANSHPAFDGLECAVERDNGGQPIRAIAKVYRKDRGRPSVAEALWREYYKPNPYGKTGVWEQMGSVMLAKCAKSLALREAFPQELNGLYTQEEMPNDYSAPMASPRTEGAALTLELAESEQLIPIYSQPTPKKTEYIYELSALPEDKEDDVLAYLDEHKAHWDAELKAWVSGKALKKLKMYEIERAALEKFRASAKDELPPEWGINTPNEEPAQ